MEEEKEIPEYPSKLNKNRKIAVIVLVVVAVFIFLAAFFDLTGNIKGKKEEGNEKNSAKSIADYSQEDSEESLRAKDTDRDGLSDWDEAYVYLTSPYIEDSDSDGIADGEEVRAGEDPNCPQGEACLSTSYYDSESTSNISGTANQGLNSSPAEEIDFSEVSGREEIESILKGESDAATLRKILLESGMSKEMLDRFTDEELMETYKQTVNTVNY